MSNSNNNNNSNWGGRNNSNDGGGGGGRHNHPNDGRGGGRMEDYRGGGGGGGYPPPQYSWGGGGGGYRGGGTDGRGGGGGHYYGRGGGGDNRGGHGHDPDRRGSGYGPYGGDHRGGGRGGDNRGRDRGSDRRGGANVNNAPRNTKNELVTFHSYEEEREWLENRRHKRSKRPTKFDQLPTNEQQLLQQQQQLLAQSNGMVTMMILPTPSTTTVVTTGAGGMTTGGTTTSPTNNMTSSGMATDLSLLTQQQTRHARRLYVGNLPSWVTEQIIHDRFRAAIDTALVESIGPDDPILSVYINHERRFAFLEFKTVEMTTACMSLDGLELEPPGPLVHSANNSNTTTAAAKVKIKRPNDYNPFLAPRVSTSAMPKLDVSRLGIISETVLDGPNKIFIGGLQYNLTDHQVLELLQAFGKVKAFHLVKNDDGNSKGYCFVEYADSAVTTIAIQGLNGMEIGGKSLTARLAGERAGSTTSGGGGSSLTAGAIQTLGSNHLLGGPASLDGSTNSGLFSPQTNAMAALNTTSTTPLLSMNIPGFLTTTPTSTKTTMELPSPDRNIVAGYDVEYLVDAAMGVVPMPTAPQYVDAFGAPLTRMVALVLPPPPPPQANQALYLLTPQQPQQQQQQPQQQPQTAVHAEPTQDSILVEHSNVAVTPKPPPSNATRILVLHNMVMDDDLSSDEDYQVLLDEVREECAKYGKLCNLYIPRKASPTVASTAVGKIYLEYESIQDAVAAEQELAGRQFGNNIVEASFYSEQDFERKELR